MALPAVYNINYYRGDTYPLWLLPKDKAGNPLPLAGYDAKFTAATKRGELGEDDESFDFVADVVGEKIKCEIPPAIGGLLSAANSYYYDVQIATPSGSEVFTYLTGTLTVTDDVSVSGA